MTKYILWLVISLAMLSISAVSSHPAAQDDEPEAIQPCTVEQLESLQPNIDVGLSHVSYQINAWQDTDLIDAVEESARTQRSLSYVVTLMPDCLETYTQFYPLMLVLDEFAIARGQMLLAAFALADERKDDFDDIMTYIDRHLREAGRILRRGFPDFYEEHYPEDWRP